MSKCCICGKEIMGYGNSALPLVEGICCDHCNNAIVILARMYWVAKEHGQAQEMRNLIHNENNPARIGANVLIVEMKDEPDYSGKRGIIEHIDDIGQLHGTWGGCALIPTEDTYFILD